MMVYETAWMLAALWGYEWVAGSAERTALSPAALLVDEWAVLRVAVLVG